MASFPVARGALFHAYVAALPPLRLTSTSCTDRRSGYTATPPSLTGREASVSWFTTLRSVPLGGVLFRSYLALRVPRGQEDTISSLRDARYSVRGGHLGGYAARQARAVLLSLDDSYVGGSARYRAQR